MTIAKELAGILDDVDRPGDFFAAGRIDLLMPRLTVEGVGPIALPLLPAQAALLVNAATQAPYGRGAQTIVDTAVRRTWQIEASRVSIGGRHWAATLDGIVARAAEGLGVPGPVAAELYKLLVYDQGSFFASHRDTEKVPGMFATLILALPSDSTGGELVVRHKDREARLDLTSAEPCEIAFAAFYADCVHEVLPVTSGCRATLVFNMVRTAEGKAPQPPSYEAEAKMATALLQDWAAALGDGTGERPDDAPEKLVVPLEHAYTPAELAFDALKGADAAVARLLRIAAPKAGCDLHLALLTMWESGSAVESGGPHRRGRYDADGDDAGEDDAGAFEVLEVIDSGRSLRDWRRPDGTRPALGELPIEDDELSPPDVLDDMEPDEEHFHEATGNEGATYERTYSRAALVVWPAKRILPVLDKAGPAATLPYLKGLLDTWTAAGARPDGPERQQAAQAAAWLVARWRAGSWADGNHARPADLGRMLGPLARLGDPALVERVLDRVAAGQGHDPANNDPILEALRLFKPATAARWLRRIVAAHGDIAPAACAALLADALAGSFAATPALLAGAAQALVARLPGDPKTARADQWGRPIAVTTDAAFVALLATVVDRIGGDPASAAGRHVLAWPARFDLDHVVVPAAVRLVRDRCPQGPAFNALLDAARAHLAVRVALPLEAPRDWARPCRIECGCAPCEDLSRFLADPARPGWTLRAAQPLRTHIEMQIRRARADVDTTTLRRGSPHSLVCTKNQASHQRRVAQREADLANLAALQMR